jgi:undecaprenyl-diphosphatase
VLIGRPGARDRSWTSRSGATISAALFSGTGARPRRASASVGLPITVGAALVKVPALVRSGADMGPVMIGMAAAAVSGLLAIRVLLGYVRTRTYVPFSIYRFAFAALVWLVLLLR